MKKVLLSAALILGFSSFSYAANTAAALTWPAEAYATGAVDFGVVANGAILTIKPSANVLFEYGCNTLRTQYTIGSKHLSGTYVYSTSSVDTNIFRNGNLTQNIPTPNADGTQGITWGGNWSASK
jgi:hypothetical protein